MRITRRVISHILLAVLLCTFMSPTFAWELSGGHDDETFAMASEGEINVQPKAHLYHHGDEESDDGVHSQIGHLLSDLPTMPHNTAIADVVEMRSGKVLTVLPALSQEDKAPPYKPPRDFHFF